jgi:serine/threonine protein phosphatase 1
MKRFVLGDSHGRAEAARDVLRKAHFDFDRDQLISLGDIVDGGLQTRQLVDLLLKVKHLIFVYGNHDMWAREWYNYGYEDPRDGFHEWNIPVWIHQGGSATIESYGGEWKNIPQSHIDFMNSGVYYYIDGQNNLFVHGGLNPHKPVEQQKYYDLMWDRDIIEYARDHVIPGYNLVFIGHTTVAHAMCKVPGTNIEFTRDEFVPLRLNNLIMMDTGGGWDGQLSLMDVDTLEYWQSHRGVDRPHEWDWC